MSKDKSDIEEKDKNPVKGLSVTPAITALFKPTADYVGQELKETVKAYVEEKKEKRRKRNLDQHLKSVQEELKQTPRGEDQKEPTLEQLSLFDEWIDNVQDIDIEDRELSEIWHNLLAKAARGGEVQSEVLEAIKKITPREAKFLYQLSGRVPTLPFHTGVIDAEDRYFARSLEGKAILEKDYSFSVVLVTAMGISLAALYYVLQEQLLVKVSITVPFLAIAILFMGLSFKSGLARWRLSWLGKTIIKFVKPNNAVNSDS